MNVRALRGATTAKGNSRQEILEATRELVLEVISRNSVKPKDLVCIIFSSTPDLNAAFPASAAREAGLDTVPLFGAQEVGVEGSPKRCIRLLALFNTEKAQEGLRHVYLRGATVLRPDIPQGNCPAPGAQQEGGTQSDSHSQDESHRTGPQSRLK